MNVTIELCTTVARINRKNNSSNLCSCWPVTFLLLFLYPNNSKRWRQNAHISTQFQPHYQYTKSIIREKSYETPLLASGFRGQATTASGIDRVTLLKYRKASTTGLSENLKGLRGSTNTSKVIRGY